MKKLNIEPPVPQLFLDFPFGDPSAFCFELFFPWIYKIMLAYHSDQERKDKQEGLLSRSLPTDYIENIN